MILRGAWWKLPVISINGKNFRYDLRFFSAFSEYSGSATCLRISCCLTDNWGRGGCLFLAWFHFVSPTSKSIGVALAGVGPTVVLKMSSKSCHRSVKAAWRAGDPSICGNGFSLVVLFPDLYSLKLKLKHWEDVTQSSKVAEHMTWLQLQCTTPGACSLVARAEEMQFSESAPVSSKTLTLTKMFSASYADDIGV